MNNSYRIILALMLCVMSSIAMGQEAKCQIHDMGPDIPLIGRITTGEKLHCTLHLDQSTVKDLVNGEIFAIDNTCSALSEAVADAVFEDSPDDVFTAIFSGVMTTAVWGVCDAAIVSELIIGEAHSCSGGYHLTIDGKATVGPPPKGHASIRGQGCH